MSRKRKSKLLGAPPVGNQNKLESLANRLFQEIMINKYNINQTMITDDFEITSFVEIEDQDKVVCYTMVPTSNKNVSVYIDNNTINVEFQKKVVVLGDNEVEKLVNNIINYLDMYFN